MISVPYTIKNLYHQDHCYKNIRIHFPNGERSDICNNLIVKDSVSFTESLCSQNTLKFGLCESPIFECEVVGVGNIKGATIEVSVEIECPFSASGAEWKADLQKYVYSIPYGTFVVDSCKRQADMVHRKIVAYTKIAAESWNVIEYENKKPNTVELYEPVLGYWLAENGVEFIADICDKEQHNWSAEDDSAPGYGVFFTAYNYTHDIQRINIGMTGSCIAWSGSYTSIHPIDHYQDFDKLFQIETTYDYNLPDILSQVYAFFTRHKRNFFTDIQVQKMVDFVKPVIDPTACICYGESGNYYSEKIGRINKYVYPYCSGYYTGHSEEFWVFVPTKIHMRAEFNNRMGQTEIFNEEIVVRSEAPTINKLTIRNSIFANIKLTIPTAKQSNPAIPYTNYYFYNPNCADVSVLSYANAMAELLGVFAFLDRISNEFRSVNIKRQFGLDPASDLYPGTSLYPQGVTGGTIRTDDYQTCWYDDEYTKPFGAVSCQYKNTNNEDCLFTLYLTGFDEDSDTSSYQVYSLENNEIIKGNTWTEAQIQAICEKIASNISGVQYMPVDFKGRGLPYVEAGDTFEILTKSNDSITTIVLNRTITGEQTLTDSYKSV